MILKKPCTKDFVQFFRDLPGIFCGSARELAHFPNVVGAGMLLAISIVLSTFVTITITPTLKLGVAYLATAMLGMIFGPVLGGLTAGLGDLIKFMIKPDGMFFPGFTLNAILGAVVYGMFFYKTHVTLTRAIISTIVVNLFLNIGLNTLWLSILTGDGYILLLVSRAWKNIALLPIEITLLFVVLRTVASLLPKINQRYAHIPQPKNRSKEKLKL